MDISDILAGVFALVATVLGILLKAENGKRMALQAQVAEERRKAYGKSNQLINDLLIPGVSKDSAKLAERTAKQLADLRQEIWQLGSDDVVRAYAIWNQCLYTLPHEGEGATAGIVLMADVIVKMREDMGLSKKGSIKPIDILRIFITDIEDKYDKHAAGAAKFKQELLSKQHISV